MLERQLSIGTKITLFIVAIILLHSVSSIVGNLGLLSDVFTLLGLTQFVKLVTNKDIKQEVLTNLQEVIEEDQIESTIKYLLELFKKDGDDKSDFKDTKLVDDFLQRTENHVFD